jgi:hypothetical protein
MLLSSAASRYTQRARARYIFHEMRFPSAFGVRTRPHVALSMLQTSEIFLLKTLKPYEGCSRSDFLFPR